MKKITNKNEKKEITKIKVMAVNYKNEIILNKINNYYSYINDYTIDGETLIESVKRITKENLNVDLKDKDVQHIMNLKNYNFNLENGTRNAYKTYYFQINVNIDSYPKLYFIPLDKLEKTLIENYISVEVNKNVLTEMLNALKVYQKQNELVI